VILRDGNDLPACEPNPERPHLKHRRTGNRHRHRAWKPRGEIGRDAAAIAIDDDQFGAELGKLRLERAQRHLQFRPGMCRTDDDRNRNREGSCRFGSCG
jgi:hypothetical protein